MIQPINWLNLLKAPGGITLGAAYQTVYDSWTDKPTDTDALIDNTMVESLVSSGEWGNDIDVFDVFAAHTNDDGESVTNWITPGTLDPVLVNGPGYVSQEGFTGDGTTTHINIINPGDGGTYKYLQNSASFGVYIRNNVAEGKYVFGSTGSCDQQLQPRSAGDEAFIKLNDNSTITLSSITDSRGFWIITRTAAAVIRVYLNGVDIGGGTGSSAALIDQMIIALAINNGGTPALQGTNQIAAVVAGGALTPTKVTNITNAFETRMDALGKGVAA